MRKQKYQLCYCKIIVASDCGGDIEATTTPQVILLPQFPNNLTICVINISASNEQNRLNITIEDSSALEQTLFCESIYVQLTTGN